MSDVTEAFTAEVVRLHDFFVEWFEGSTSDGFAAFDDAMGSDFYLVTPDGTLRSRMDIVEAVRSAGGSGPVAIWIEAPAVHSVSGDVIVGTYEEHQRREDMQSSRRSTAVLRRDRAAPAGWTWLTVHETWIEPPREVGAAQASTPASR